MTDRVTADPAQALAFGVYPPAIDVSTAANKQIFAAQFSVANLSGTESVSIARALLLVPVSSTGTNLARNTDFAYSADTPGWTLESASPQTGYAAFLLLPNDGVGALAPGGSVALTLSNVEVSCGPPGDATLPFEAKTSLGTWTTEAGIELTAPSTTPRITRHSVTPADDPNSPTTLQGQSVIINWTSTGAASCTIVDDQGNTWPNLPTGGTIIDTPIPGGSVIQNDQQLGRHYIRAYKLTAFAAGEPSPDQWSGWATIQLPTIQSFAVSPQELPQIGAPVTVSWSVTGIDPSEGSVTLTLAPTDGTGPYTIEIPPNQTSGTAVVTPTPSTTTTYALAADSGHGLTAPPPPIQSVTSPLAAGLVAMDGLALLSASPFPYATMPVSLVAFAGRLWCGCSPAPPRWPYSQPSLSTTADGSAWSAVTSPMPAIDGLVVTSNGGVETLWAFGTNANAPVVASSTDGQNWTMHPAPPYAVRFSGSYAALAGRLYVAGGYSTAEPVGNFLGDVWSSPDGSAWENVKNFPDHVQLAAFAGALWALTADENSVPSFTKSSDGGVTWTSQAAPPTTLGWGYTLQPVGDQLWLMGAGGTVEAGYTPEMVGPYIMSMDTAGSWTELGVMLPLGFTGLPPFTVFGALSACEFAGCLWFVFTPGKFMPGATSQFFLVNQILPGTTFTLAPPNEVASQ